MFKNEPDAKAKAQKIADWLGDIKPHKSHSRPLMGQECKDNGLKIDFLEEDQKLQDYVLSVFHSTMLTFAGSNCVKFVENHNGKGLYLRAQIQIGPPPLPAPPPPRR